MLEPVRHRSLSESVFEQLRTRILSGQLEAGESLPAERVLAEVLGVNRGAVREALKRLQQAGLVQVHQGGATRVLDYQEAAGLDLLPALLLAADGQVRTDVVRSVMEMRSALAPDVAAQAARRGGPAAVAALAPHLAGLRAGRDLAELQRCSLAFWAELVRASGNVAYVLAHNSLRDIYERALELLRPVLAEELQAADRYAALVAAVAAGDADAAAGEARALVGLGAAAVEDVLCDLERRAVGRKA